MAREGSAVVDRVDVDVAEGYELSSAAYAA